MQSGILKKKIKVFLKKLKRLLKMEVFSFRKSFYSFYVLFYGFREKISPKKLQSPYVFTNNLHLELKEGIKTCELQQNEVKINDALLSKNAVVTKKIFIYDVYNLVVRTLENIEKYVKWKSENLSIITIFRNFYFQIKNQQPKRLDAEISKRMSFNKLPKDVIALQRKVSTVEEIVEMEPFVKKLSLKKLYQLPIEKKPMPKYFFSQKEMSYIKETMAKSANVTPRNVEVTYIYDKFNIEFYSKIKQDAATKNLLCYPDVAKMNHTKTDRIYYLVFGFRKDNKVQLNALVDLAYMPESQAN